MPVLKNDEDQPMDPSLLISVRVVPCLELIVQIQGSPFITLCLESIECNRIKSEMPYKGTISYRN